MNTRFFLFLFSFVSVQAAVGGDKTIAETFMDSTVAFSKNYVGQIIYPAASSPDNTITTFKLKISGAATLDVGQTIYVFKSPYAGSPDSMAGSPKVIAKSQTSDGLSFVFDSSVKFTVSNPYYFYFGSPITGNGFGTEGGNNEVRRDSQQPYLLYDGSSYNTQSVSLAFSLKASADQNAGSSSVTSSAITSADIPITSSAITSADLSADTPVTSSAQPVTSAAAAITSAAAPITSADLSADKPVTSSAQPITSAAPAKGPVTSAASDIDENLTTSSVTTGTAIVAVNVTVTVVTITVSSEDVDQAKLTTSILSLLGLPESDAYRVKFVVSGKEKTRDSSISFYIAPGQNPGDKDASDLTTSLVSSITSEPTALNGFEVTSAPTTVQKTETVNIKAGTTLTTSAVTTAAMTSGVHVTQKTILANFKADATFPLSSKYIGQAVVMTSSSKSNDQTTFKFPASERDLFTDQILYVFDNPYSGDPATIDAADYLGKIKTKDGRSWIFPSTVQFTIGTKYYFYLGAPVTGSVGIVNVGKRSIDNAFMVYDGTSYAETSHTLAFSLVAAPDDGEGDGDPFFIGFNNQHFEFDGTAGRMYNIYNDPYVNLNSLFGTANKNTLRGTVMTAFGISIGMHSISMSIDAEHSKTYFDIVIDGVITRIGSNTLSLSGCVDVQYKNALLITTPKHDIYVYPVKGHGRHINVDYFNIHIHHPEEDETKIGGVLGQTADNSNRISIEEENFVVDSMFSFAASRFYQLTTIEC